MKKLQNTSGETLAESLCAILIICLCMLFLATALVTASRIQNTAQAENQDFSYLPQAQEPGVLTVNGIQHNIVIYENNGYYFYTDPAQEAQP